MLIKGEVSWLFGVIKKKTVFVLTETEKWSAVVINYHIMYCVDGPFIITTSKKVSLIFLIDTLNGSE